MEETYPKVSIITFKKSASYLRPSSSISGLAHKTVYLVLSGSIESILQ